MTKITFIKMFFFVQAVQVLKNRMKEYNLTTEGPTRSITYQEIKSLKDIIHIVEVNTWTILVKEIYVKVKG